MLPRLHSRKAWKGNIPDPSCGVSEAWPLLGKRRIWVDRVALAVTVVGALDSWPFGAAEGSSRVRIG